MSNTRLISDCAFETSQQVVHVFANLLRDEELNDAVLEVYELVRTGLERFVERQRREWRRLHGPPGDD